MNTSRAPHLSFSEAFPEIFGFETRTQLQGCSPSLIISVKEWDPSLHVFFRRRLDRDGSIFHTKIARHGSLAACYVVRCSFRAGRPTENTYIKHTMDAFDGS